MIIGKYRINRLEFSGSLGDLGTLIPLSVAMIIINGLSASTVFLMVGVFYITTGFFFNLPIPVQPLKVVAAVSIASPQLISESTIMASGILLGILLLILAFTGFIDWLYNVFSKPIIRGIQLGLGLILLTKGIDFILKSALFLHIPESIFTPLGISVNTLIGIIAVLVVLILISNKKYPTALIIVTVGILIGVLFGSLKESEVLLGPVPFKLPALTVNDFINALILLVIPQIPLTIGNAIIGTVDACQSFFQNSENSKKVNPKNLSLSMGLMNILIGFLGGLPLCHGAGGLAAHYRFGARTGGSNIMIGLIFVIIALIFGQMAISLLSSIPNAVLGTLLLFAGIELSMLIRDMKERKDLFVVMLVAGIGFATTNMGIALVAGWIISKLINWKKNNL